MIIKTIIFSITVCLLAVSSVKAQNTSSDSTIVGVWKGTSICQIKNSPCHDEVVVYYISKVSGLDTFNIKANKIVNGKEEEMGDIGFKLDRKNNRLTSTAYNSLWTFNIKGKDLDGTLYHDGKLYRIIELTKQK